ncbi:hypothetical protein QUB60_14245 [Microcoleus sp. A2-C5]|uniref:hypothetical protein n=1 Tax=Microcoleaceae TaxID=1892252 RepID=UPI002238A950|nr:hypothetical protein [Lyngbya sp. CCAP 1446/10]MCW6052243.1 hypothetical protein [Lyngbya sp. CCAP 1446/10]
MNADAGGLIFRAAVNWVDLDGCESAFLQAVRFRQKSPLLFGVLLANLVDW